MPSKKRLFSKRDDLIALADCEDTLQRVGKIRKLCEAIEVAGKEKRVIIRSDQRAELFTKLTQAQGRKAKLDILEDFCNKYNF